MLLPQIFEKTLVLQFSNAEKFSSDVPTNVVTLTQVVTSVHLGQTHLGTPFQVSAWVRKISLGSTRDDYFFGDVTCHQF